MSKKSQKTVSNRDFEKYNSPKFDPKSMDFRLWANLHIAKGEIVICKAYGSYGDDKPLIDYYDSIDSEDLNSFDRSAVWGLNSWKGAWKDVVWEAVLRSAVKLQIMSH